eukprot:SAG25_NODE_206_length_11883_cov_5.639511_5_plen_73_part_00
MPKGQEVPRRRHRWEVVHCNSHICCALRSKATESSRRQVWWHVHFADDTKLVVNCAEANYGLAWRVMAPKKR